MIWTGLVILVFVVIHLAQFKFGALYQIGDPPIRDLYRTEVEVFSSPFWVGAYVVCMVLVGFHLRHGIASAFQSLGADHPRLHEAAGRAGHGAGGPDRRRLRRDSAVGVTSRSA